MIKKNDTVEKAVGYYLLGNTESINERRFTNEFDNDDFALNSIGVRVVDDWNSLVLDEYQELEINIDFTLKHLQKALHVTLVLNNEYGEPLFTFSHVNVGLQLKQGRNRINCKLPKGFLNIGSYYVSFFVIEDAKSALFVEKDVISFTIQEGERPIGSWMGKEPGFIKPVFDWKID
jgi:lipopolysaccharide transport system ATP-binding protein